MLHRFIAFKPIAIIVSELEYFLTSICIVWCWYLIPDHKLQIAEKKIAELWIINSYPATLSVMLSNARPSTLEVVHTHNWSIILRVELMIDIFCRHKQLVFYYDGTFICRYCTKMWQELIKNTIWFVFTFFLNILIYYIDLRYCINFILIS